MRADTCSRRRGCGNRRNTARRLGTLVASAWALAPSPGGAQVLAPEIAVESRLDATDNRTLAAPGEAHSDLGASLRPSIVWHRQTPGLRVDIDTAVRIGATARAPRSNGVRVNGRASMQSVLVEHWLGLDAGVIVRQSPSDPFGPEPSDFGGGDRRSQASYVLSPHVEHEVGADTWLLARHQHSLIRNAAGSTSHASMARSSAEISRTPGPFGASLQGSRFEADPGDGSAGRLTLEMLRVAASLAPFRELLVGASLGRERSRFLGTAQTDTVPGVLLRWKPGPRTSLVMNLEQRFFGTGGTVEWAHRTPQFAINAKWSRQPDLATPVGGVAPSGDLRPLLDAILTTRHPDEEERRTLVDSLITSRGLDTGAPTAAATAIVGARPQLVSAGEAHVAALGRRDTAILTLFAQTARQLTRDRTPIAQGAITDDTRQLGGSLQFSRWLAPKLTGNVVVRWSRITGFAARAGESSSDAIVRVTLRRDLAPRSGVFAGVQRDRFSTDAPGQHAYCATTAFIGFGHRF